MNRILFAGGGTAGHIEPALAVANSWCSKYPEDQIAFLGTKDGLENQLLQNFKLFLIPKVTAPRKLNLKSFLSPFQFLYAIYKTIRIVKNFNLIVGFGGYVSAPAYVAAAMLRKPIVIHEANAKAGVANRLGSKFSSNIAVGYELAQLQLPKSIVVGNPLKPEIISAAKQSDWLIARQQAKEKIGAPLNKPMILILGGSLGAKAINNVINNVINDVIHGLNLSNYFVLHSVGKNNDLPKANENYHPVNYINDMAGALLAADLIISRSGAISCTEIAALGRFALFIPLPIGNGEQALNAQELINNGRAELVLQQQFNSDWLASHLPNLMGKALASSPEPTGTQLATNDLMVAMIERALR